MNKYQIRITGVLHKKTLIGWRRTKQRHTITHNVDAESQAHVAQKLKHLKWYRKDRFTLPNNPNLLIVADNYVTRLVSEREYTAQKLSVVMSGVLESLTHLGKHIGGDFSTLSQLEHFNKAMLTDLQGLNDIIALGEQSLPVEEKIEAVKKRKRWNTILQELVSLSQRNR